MKVIEQISKDLLVAGRLLPLLEIPDMSMITDVGSPVNS
jgi:hypothetical protein